MQKRLFVCFVTLLPLIFLIGTVAADPSPTLSDEFNDSSTLADWQLGPAPATTWLTMDIDSSTNGNLVIVPSNNNDSGGTGNNGWYQVARGPYLYKLVTGDFVATSYIVAGNVADNSAAPSGDFNSAGFIARDPASTRNNENWVMYNHGHQTNGLATETKTTDNSSSVLILRGTDGSNSGQLTMCRSGDNFHMFKWMDNEDGWTLEQTYARPDLPDTLQVGTVVNGWTQPNLYAQFDYVRMYTGTIDSPADCLDQLTVPTAVELGMVSAENEGFGIGRFLLIKLILIIGIFWTIRQKTLN